MKKHDIGKLVWGFAKELTNHVAGGMEKVDPVTFKKRMEACVECPNFTKESTCALCGCYMPVKTKWATSKCPDDPPKWNRHAK